MCESVCVNSGPPGVFEFPLWVKTKLISAEKAKRPMTFYIVFLSCLIVKDWCIFFSCVCVENLVYLLMLQQWSFSEMLN